MARTWGAVAAMAVAVALVCAAPAGAVDATPKIVGGSNATIEQYPYQVFVQIDAPGGGYFQCGGSIIDQTHVVTAGHCITDEDTGVVVAPQTVVVGYGATDTNDLDVSDVTQIQAPSAYPSDPSYDVARLTLAAPLQGYGGPAVRAVPLGNEADLAAGVSTGRSAYASGWGRTTETGTTSDTLRATPLTLRADSLCGGYNGYVPVRNVCAGGTGTSPSGNPDTCQGDSGGPLVLDGSLVGVTAYGAGCGRFQTPGAYTQVTESTISSLILTGAIQPSVPAAPSIPAAPVSPQPVVPRDLTRPTLRYSRFSCTRKRRCTVTLRAADRGGAVARLKASVSRKVRSCRRRDGRRRCRTVRKRTTLRVKRVSRGFAASATLAKGTYALSAVATDASGNRSKTLKRTLRVKR